jgi:hypothetical protein
MLHALETLHIYWKKRDKTTRHTVCYASNNNDSKLKQYLWRIHCKKRLAIFPFLAGKSLTKLSLARHNLIIPGQ